MSATKLRAVFRIDSLSDGNGLAVVDCFAALVCMRDSNRGYTCSKGAEMLEQQLARSRDPGPSRQGRFPSRCGSRSETRAARAGLPSGWLIACLRAPPGAELLPQFD